MLIFNMKICLHVVCKELIAQRNTYQNVIYHFLNQLSVFHESRTKCNLFQIIYCCLSKHYQKVYYNNLSLTAETSLIFIYLFVFHCRVEPLQVNSRKEKGKRKHLKNHKITIATFLVITVANSAGFQFHRKIKHYFSCVRDRLKIPHSQEFRC